MSTCPRSIRGRQGAAGAVYQLGYPGQSLAEIEREAASRYARMIGHTLSDVDLLDRQRKGRLA